MIERRQYPPARPIRAVSRPADRGRVRPQQSGWNLPYKEEQKWGFLHNDYQSRPKTVLAFHIERDTDGHETGRTPAEMHLGDAERVIREFPGEWSRTAAAEPVVPEPEPDPLKQIDDLAREMRALEARLTATRKEVEAMRNPGAAPVKARPR